MRHILSLPDRFHGLGHGSHKRSPFGLLVPKLLLTLWSEPVVAGADRLSDPMGMLRSPLERLENNQIQRSVDQAEPLCRSVFSLDKGSRRDGHIGRIGPATYKKAARRGKPAGDPYGRADCNQYGDQAGHAEPNTTV